MGTFDVSLWREAFSSVQTQFKIDCLFPEQEESIRAFMENRNVFVNLPTGYGKSLIFQCLPIVADILTGKPRGSSVLLVISPLRSLMDDHVQYLETVFIPAIAIKDEEDPEIIQQVMNGYYVIVYCSPECMLSTATWRGIFQSESFREKLIGVAIDEAHVITQWGLAGAHKDAFRKWYGCLGEVRSLIPQECNIMVLTATATNFTKDQILDTLHIKADDITMIEQSPNRPNLCYTKQYLDKNDPLEKQFGALIAELKAIGTNTPRTLIYCQTRKQCSVLFCLFEVYIGNKIFHGGMKPQNRLVEMYHAGTPEAVKKHISENMANDNGHIRVLISTIAFGMGVNCKKVRRVVHFGPSKTVESYIQECGRAGRDGQQSTCLLFFNGLLSAHCDSDMKQYLRVEGCSRQWLMAHFDCKLDHSKSTIMHECCDNCMQNCKCGLSGCRQLWSPQLDDECDKHELFIADYDSQNRLTRSVSQKDKVLLKKRLVKLQHDMLSKVQLETMVSCPNILLEFNLFHINQVLGSCHSLFTVQDVLESVEIWRNRYAIEILKILKEVFGDTNIELPSELEESVLDDTNFSEWNMIRDDSTFANMIDSQDFEDLDSTMESQECSVDSSSQTMTQ